MMKRHFISVVTVGILTLLLLGGVGASGLWAADSKAVPPAAPADNAAEPAAKTVPATPVGGPVGSAATKAVPEASGQPLPSAAALQPAPVYEYNPTGKSDPFAPFMETDPVMKAKLEEALRKKMLATKGRPISPLQQMEIDQLRLVGIAGNDHRRTAIVEDGVAKKHYPLSVGTYIGLNGGRVALIRPDRVIVEERLPGQSPKAKKPKVKRITMMLHKEDEGKP